MYAIEILHTYRPEGVGPGDVHLSAAERTHYAQQITALENYARTADVMATEQMGPFGEALEFAGTIAYAGEALCHFMLARPVMNPLELALAKYAVEHCYLTVEDFIAHLALRLTEEELAAHVNQFLAKGDVFRTLFADLQAHAKKRFPHLAANNGKGE